MILRTLEINDGRAAVKWKRAAAILVRPVTGPDRRRAYSRSEPGSTSRSTLDAGSAAALACGRTSVSLFNPCLEGSEKTQSPAAARGSVVFGLHWSRAG